MSNDTLVEVLELVLADKVTTRFRAYERRGRGAKAQLQVQYRLHYQNPAEGPCLRVGRN